MSDPLCVAIIQGRMGSSRLPGKVLLDISGKPMLQHVIERTRRARRIDRLVVATSSEPSDDPIAEFCAGLGVACARGSLHDVLDRFYQAAVTQNATRIVRITADCPMIDPGLIDETIRLLDENRTSKPVDFAANRLPPPFGRTFPIGLDVEVCTFEALQRAWQEGTQTFQREHVMPFLYEGTQFTESLPDSPLVSHTPLPEYGRSGPEITSGVKKAAPLPPSRTPHTVPDTLISYGVSPRGFGIAQLQHNPDYGGLRWTVDTPADLEFARQVFARLGGKPEFTWLDVLDVLQKEPGLAAINAEVRHKTMTDVEESPQA